MYNITIDQSTFSTKAILFDDKANVVGRINKAHRQITPCAGWVEHDPEEIYENLKWAVKELLEANGVPSEEIQYLSITNQRETTVVWDETGKPAYHAIVWQCARASEITERPEIATHGESIKSLSGMNLSPYFSAAKARWIKENTAPGRKLYFGTMDSWLIFKLTGNHVTDYSNASRTQLMNLKELCWDDDLVGIFGLEDMVLPKILPSDSIFGETDLDGVFHKKVPVCGVMGDSHGALFGQHCWKPGMGKCTFGTGSSVMVNIGDVPLLSDEGLATSVAWNLSGKTQYVYEGNINCTGDTLNWLQNEMEILPDAMLSEEYATKVEENYGVYLVPAFLGLGAPYYDAEARGIICGLFRNANKYHIVRAALESIAYQINDILLLMKKKMSLEELRVDGGATRNAFLMQFVSDICQVGIVKNQIEELSALGAYYAGGLGTGMFQNREEIEKLYRADRIYRPKMERQKADLFYTGWQKAVTKARANCS